MDVNSDKDISKLIKQVNALLWGVGGILAVVVVCVSLCVCVCVSLCVSLCV